eukprot:TRINITY_DN19356_c0_g2_i1.p1 TRINITY_DN19356_c0_g2~~TRINITY_DN19356_c0_g2_i1.p1  ORF type:complete len:578 (-),score=78.66 TRINITY_DN19356_c0_g2_i1:235-1968(-)
MPARGKIQKKQMKKEIKFRGRVPESMDEVERLLQKGRSVEFIRSKLFARGLSKGRVSQLCPIAVPKRKNTKKKTALPRKKGKRSHSRSEELAAEPTTPLAGDLSHEAPIQTSDASCQCDISPRSASSAWTCPCHSLPIPASLDHSTVGICKTKEDKFKASLMMQGFSIDTWIMPDVEQAWRNRKAMERVHQRVCQWLAEDRLPDEAVTDAEFVAFVRGVVEEVRATWPDLVQWRYHSEIKVAVENPITTDHDDQEVDDDCLGKRAKEKMALHRVNTVGNIAEALRGWRQLRARLGVSGVFNLAECVDKLRDKAEEIAQEIMDGLAPGAFPTDEQALDVLRAWGFERNKNRLNVIPEGMQWVASDTLGLVLPKMPVRGRRDPVVSRATRGHETVFRVIHDWIQGRLARDHGRGTFPCTSMSLNKNYAAKLHRDARNDGPSVAISAGDFSGGRLKYWPTDDGHADLKGIQLTPHVVLDTKSAPCVFDGNLAHEVEAFSGERFSVVMFTCAKRLEASAETRAHFAKLSIDMPTTESLQRWRSELAPVATSSAGQQKTSKRIRNSEKGGKRKSRLMATAGA